MLCSPSLLANTVKTLGLPHAFPCYSSGLVPSIVNKNDLCIQDKVLNMSHLYNFLVPLQDLESINHSCEVLAPLWFAALCKNRIVFPKYLSALSWTSQKGVGSEVSAHSFYNRAHARQKALCSMDGAARTGITCAWRGWEKEEPKNWSLLG